MYSIQDRHGKVFLSCESLTPVPLILPCALLVQWEAGNQRELSRVRRVVSRTGKCCLKRLKQLRLALIKENLKSDLVIVCIFI